MALNRNRRRVLLGLFLVTAVVVMLILSQVLGTVFFAITVAYVLFPVRQRLVGRGHGARVSATLATLVGFVSLLVAIGPIFGLLYVRRQEFIDFIQGLPAEVPVALLGFEDTIDVSEVIALVQRSLSALAVDLARAAPVAALKLALFVLLVYALLLRPHDIRAALLELVPPAYHDILLGFHDRVRATLYAIYVLQAATAFGTFLIAWVVFAMLGYDSALSLAVISGILQFIPVVGPSVVVIALAAYQVTIGNAVAALLVTVFGLVLIGFMPDAIIRTQLASFTTDMPGSLYFVGFVGGILTLGLAGFIAGPLAVALLLESGELLSMEMGVEPSGED